MLWFRIVSVFFIVWEKECVSFFNIFKNGVGYMNIEKVVFCINNVGDFWRVGGSCFFF